MKIAITCLLLLFVCSSLHAQQLTFVRVYDNNGKKINKGWLFATTDSSMVVYRGDNKVEIPVRQVGFIKSKHSVAHRILHASLVTAAVITIIPAVILYLHVTRTGNKTILPYGKNKNVNPEAIPQKRRLQRRYTINSSLENWQAQRLLLAPFL